MAKPSTALPFRVVYDPLDNFNVNAVLLKQEVEQALLCNVLPTGFAIQTPGGTILEVANGCQPEAEQPMSSAYLVAVRQATDNQPDSVVRVTISLDAVLKEDKSTEHAKRAAVKPKKPTREFKLTAEPVRPVRSGQQQRRSIVVGARGKRSNYSSEVIMGPYPYLD